METAIATALIAFLGSILIAVLTYWTTKRREREAKWRKEKLAYYKAFVESLSGIIEGDSSLEGHRSFAKATNNLLLFAPQPVIVALNKFRHEIRVSNSHRTQEQHDHLLAALLLSIRIDIGVSPEDEPETFKPVLWASGTDKNAS
jgi:hypothetical protein